MLTIALTGGLATGKSHVRVRVATLGLPTIDADTIAREVVRPGEPAWRDIRQRFGNGIWKADGTLDRPALASIIFSDAAARKDLEDILHPRVYLVIRSWLNELAQARIHRAAVADNLHGVEEGRYVGHPVLEQVSESPGIRGDQLGGIAFLDVVRQHQHR